jgi:hypothetical protein
MSRLPIAIGATAFASVTISALAFALDSGPVTGSAVSMIIIGVFGLVLVGLAGLILVRAPWARWLLSSTVVFAILLASTNESGPFWVALALGSLALIGLSGPWLTLWMRRQPVADRLGAVPMALIASGTIAPVYVGLAAFEGVSAVHWTYVAVIAASAWSYGRGLPFGIWGFRTLVPILGLLAATRTSSPGDIVVATGALALSAVAWTPQARAVTAVITPPLPAPASRRESGDASR